MIYVSIGALFAALAPLFFTWISLRERNEQSVEDRQAERINNLEQMLGTERAASDALRRENYELRSKVLTLEKSQGG